MEDLILNARRELQIPEGHLWGKLQKGQIVHLIDGRDIDPNLEEIVGPKRPGNSIVFTGDTCSFPELQNFASGADYLISESTYIVHRLVGHPPGERAVTDEDDDPAGRVLAARLERLRDPEGVASAVEAWEFSIQSCSDLARAG